MEVINIASDLGVIHKGGAWYTVSVSDTEKPKFQGAEKVRAFLLENPKVYDTLITQVKQTMGII